MEVLWFWLLVVLLLVAVIAWPSWPYTRTRPPYTRGGAWVYAVSGLALLFLVVLLLLFWFGMITLWWPWVAV